MVRSVTRSVLFRNQILLCQQVLYYIILYYTIGAGVVTLVVPDLGREVQLHLDWVVERSEQGEKG